MDSLAEHPWYFATSQIPGDHFVLNKCGDVPEFLSKAYSHVKPHGDVKAVITDIEGCYPNMPVEAIKFGLRSVARLLKEKGHEGVRVPKFSKKKPCSWSTRQHSKEVWLDWDTMLKVMEFTLENTLIELDGNILKQSKGVPMGGPISPGMTIGACAWMEMEWLNSVAQEDKKFFKAARYMDDILCIYAETDKWDSARFLEYQSKECYMPPLELQEAGNSIFLETEFEIHKDEIQHRLKNVNIEGEAPKVWRYQHYNSYGSYIQKKGTLMGCLRKVNSMASNEEQLMISGRRKLAEFKRIGFPSGVRKFACSVIARDSGNIGWMKLRKEQ